MPRKRRAPLTEADHEAARRFRALWDQAQAARGFTQDSAAHDIGVTQGMISSWLAGRYAISLKATFKLARFLKCQPHDIRPDLDQIVFGSGELSHEAVALAIHWQDCLPKAAQKAIADIVYSYPPPPVVDGEERATGTVN